ncbi:MCE family protein [Nocardia sp. NPDC005366]|uniref:MCE family protein n=1 Tax=Nocardia sp. NPDC005366 TaxID=3156878 RepID=UPI0033A1135D
MIRHNKEHDTFRAGIVGTALIVLVVLATMNIDALPLTSSHTGYRALFTDTGGLESGDVVEISGVDSGRVREISIENATVAVEFSLDDDLSIGVDTTAQIVTATVLGARHLRLIPAGTRPLRAGDTIPLERTRSPYNLTDALGDLTDTAGAIDTAQLTTSMRVLSDTLQNTPEDLRAAVAGVGRLSATVADRDRSLRELLTHAERVTGVLAERSAQLGILVDDAAVVLGELQHRREAVNTLFANVTELATQLSGLVRDNETQLAPALDQLTSVLAILRANRDNIATAIERLGPYMTELGEAVASGPFFNSYIQNLIPGQIIEPFIRAALGPPVPSAQPPADQPQEGR